MCSVLVLMPNYQHLWDCGGSLSRFNESGRVFCNLATLFSLAMKLVKLQCKSRIISTGLS